MARSFSSPSPTRSSNRPLYRVSLQFIDQTLRSIFEQTVQDRRPNFFFIERYDFWPFSIFYSYLFVEKRRFGDKTSDWKVAPRTGMSENRKSRHFVTFRKHAVASKLWVQISSPSSQKLLDIAQGCWNIEIITFSIIYDFRLILGQKSTLETSVPVIFLNVLQFTNEPRKIFSNE